MQQFTTAQPPVVDGDTGMSNCLLKEDIEMLQAAGDISFNFTVTECDSDDLTEMDPGFGTQFTPALSISLVVIYSMLALIALTMNIFIVVVIFKNKLHRKATYVFIVNLALSDIVMLVFNMPIYLYYIMVNDWVFGRALCHIAYPTFSLPVFVSSWTIMLISLDRCIAAHPGNKYGITRCHACLMIVAVIIVSLLLSTPLIMYTKYDRPQDYLPNFIKDNRALCIESWPNPKSRTLYGTIILSTQFILPVVVTIVLHTQIYKILEQRLRMTRSSLADIHGMAKYTMGKSSAEIRAKKSCERKKAVGKTLFSIVVVFVICWSPTVIFMLIMDTAPKIVPTEQIGLIHCVLKILATSSSCINPIFYGWLNRAFREEAVKLIKTCGGPNCIQQKLKRRLSTQSNGPDSENRKTSDTQLTNVSNAMRKPSSATACSDMAVRGIKVPTLRSFGRSKRKKEISVPSSSELQNLSSKQTDNVSNIQITTTDCSMNAGLDYRSWDNSSLGPFLTPAASPAQTDSEDEDCTLTPCRLPKRQLSVRFSNNNNSTYEDNVFESETEQDIFVSMKMSDSTTGGNAKKRRLKCLPSREKTTIHYSIVIANNILQNLIVNTATPSKQQDRKE